MKKRNFTALFVLACTVFYFGCQKGDTGPAGAKGAPGSANVQYSSWTPLAMTFNFSDSLYEQTLRADSLTQRIIDSGIVITYLKFTDPSTQATTIVNAGTYMEEDFSVGQIKLYSQYNFSSYNYRYVLIPGGVKVGRMSSGQIISKSNAKNVSYEDAMRLSTQTSQ